jgi:bis(5'-nucleosyl)-tetraphosphatase (symmetrical)
MATYMIGDVQGCYQPLMHLLEKIAFDQHHDKLWFAGDLVNRGPHSLDVLRFVSHLGAPHGTVLGNHDLHLLAIAYGVRSSRSEDTLTAILNAPDRDYLLDWLVHQPFLYHDVENQVILTHAGLAPQWSLTQALDLGKEVETALRHNPQKFLQETFGNQPDQWREDLVGAARWRCIVNYFTRMRFCYPDGRLDFSRKTTADADSPYQPWFTLPMRVNKNIKLVFGHWAALAGETHTPHTFALDTGCAWGECLTALRLQDEKRFSVSCAKKET